MYVRTALQHTEDGIRPGEPKTESGKRTIPLDSGMLESLKRHRVSMTEEALRLGSAWQNQTDFVFVTSIGTQLNSKNLIRRDYRPVLKKAGLPERLRLHDLRHFFASFNLSRGVPVTTVSKIMGHHSPAVTWSIYSHCIPGDERAIADNMSVLRTG